MNPQALPTGPENQNTIDKTHETQQLNNEAKKIAERIGTEEAFIELEELRCTTLAALKDLQKETCSGLDELQGEIDYTQGEVSQEEFEDIQSEFDDVKNEEKNYYISGLSEVINERGTNSLHEPLIFTLGMSPQVDTKIIQEVSEDIQKTGKISLSTLKRLKDLLIGDITLGKVEKGQMRDEFIAGFTSGGITKDMVSSYEKSDILYVLQDIFDSHQNYLHDFIFNTDLASVFGGCSGDIIIFIDYVREKYRVSEKIVVSKNINNFLLSHGIEEKFLETLKPEIDNLSKKMQTGGCSVEYITDIQDFLDLHFKGSNIKIDKDSALLIIGSVIKAKRTDLDIEKLNAEEVTDEQEREGTLAEIDDDKRTLENQEERTAKIGENIDDVIRMDDDHRLRFKKLISSGGTKEEIDNFIESFRKEELLYIQDADALIEIFKDMKEGNREIPKKFRLSDIAPELRGREEVLKSFPGNFEWVDILLIPERVLKRRGTLAFLLTNQISDPQTVNRLLYRSLNVMSPQDAYNIFIDVFSKADVDQKRALGKMIPPVISKQDTGALNNYIAENQDEFFEGMLDIDKVLTTEGINALENEDYYLLAMKTIKDGKFEKTENLKYAISQYPRLAKLALKENPKNIMFLPTELRSDLVIISAWIDAIPDKNSAGGLENIHLLVLDKPYKLKSVYEKIIEKFWDGDMSVESVQELIDKQPKLEYIIRSMQHHPENNKNDATSKLLNTATIDYQLSKAIEQNAEIKGEQSDQDYYWDIRSIITQSVKATSPESQKLAEANIDELTSIFHGLEEGDVNSKQEAISKLIRIFGTKDAKLFLEEFTSSILQKRKAERDERLASSEVEWKNINNSQVRELLGINSVLEKIKPDNKKINTLLKNFIAEKKEAGVTDLETIRQDFLSLVDSYDGITEEQIKVLRKEFNYAWDNMDTEFLKQNNGKIVEAIHSGKNLEDIYDEYLIDSVISGKLLKENGEDNTNPNSPNIPSNTTDSLSSIPEGVRKTDGGYVLETDNETISITQADLRILEINPEARKDIVRVHAAFEKVGFGNLWDNNKEDIFTSVRNVHGIGFSVDGNYINDNELRILFNSILISIDEEPIESSTGSIDSFLTEMERRNKTSFTGAEAEVNSFGETSIEEKFLKKYFPKGSMMFEYSAFEKSIK